MRNLEINARIKLVLNETTEIINDDFTISAQSATVATLQEEIYKVVDKLNNFFNTNDRKNNDMLNRAYYEGLEKLPFIPGLVMADFCEVEKSILENKEEIYNEDENFTINNTFKFKTDLLSLFVKLTYKHRVQ